MILTFMPDRIDGNYPSTLDKHSFEIRRQTDTVHATNRITEILPFVGKHGKLNSRPI